MGSSFLLLGSNLGERLINLQKARQQISRTLGKIITVSSVYKTAAWGNTDQPDFYNQVVEIVPTGDVHSALSAIHQVEQLMGRVRQEKWGSRLIDIDILLWDMLVIHEPNLIIPHAQLANRRFALVPLAELAPDRIHPVLKKTIRQLLAECPDSLDVIKLEL